MFCYKTQRCKGLSRTSAVALALLMGLYKHVRATSKGARKPVPDAHTEQNRTRVGSCAGPPAEPAIGEQGIPVERHKL